MPPIYPCLEAVQTTTVCETEVTDKKRRLKERKIMRVSALGRRSLLKASSYWAALPSQWPCFGAVIIWRDCDLLSAILALSVFTKNLTSFQNQRKIEKRARQTKTKPSSAIMSCVVLTLHLNVRWRVSTYITSCWNLIVLSVLLWMCASTRVQLWNLYD